jgi:2-iminobutanoate/2-iminopropanoate deaminase
MVTKEVVATPNSPKLPTQYSQALKVTPGTFIFCSGLTARDPRTNEILYKGDYEGQARQVFEHLRGLLEASGASCDDVVQLRIYYKDDSFIPKVIEMRNEYFTNEPFPAITALVCDLSVPDMLIEMDAIAVI